MSRTPSQSSAPPDDQGKRKWEQRWIDAEDVTWTIWKKTEACSAIPFGRLQAAGRVVCPVRTTREERKKTREGGMVGVDQVLNAAPLMPA